MHNGGDGTSASSIGTESPDIFQNGDLTKGLTKSSYNGSDVQITEEKISSGMKLSTFNNINSIIKML